MKMRFYDKRSNREVSRENIVSTLVENFPDYGAGQLEKLQSEIDCLVKMVSMVATDHAMLQMIERFDHDGKFKEGIPPQTGC